MDVNNDSETETKKCLVCLDIIDDEKTLYFLPCWHFFHEICITRWLRNNVYCPLCKVPIFIESIEQMEKYEEYTRSQIGDEKVRIRNLGNDTNSISYRFMQSEGIRNSFGYDDDNRRRDYYETIIDDGDEKKYDEDDFAVIGSTTRRRERVLNFDDAEMIELQVPLRPASPRQILPPRANLPPLRPAITPMILSNLSRGALSIEIPRSMYSSTTDEIFGSIFSDMSDTVSINDDGTNEASFNNETSLLNNALPIVQLYNQPRITALDILFNEETNHDVLYDTESEISVSDNDGSIEF